MTKPSRLVFKVILVLAGVFFIGHYFDRTVANINKIEGAVENIQVAAQ